VRAVEAEARSQRDYANTIISAMHEGYALSVEGEIKAVNEALCQLVGFSEEELLGLREPFPFFPPERRAENMELSRRIVERRGGTFEMTLMRKDGERFEAEMTTRPAVDQAGNVLGFVNTLRDVSVQRRQQRELEVLARTDSLTGLANRHVLQESLERAAAVARRNRRRLALVLLDLDWFKQVNDRYGHPVGDAVLIEVARRLERTVRDGEVLARVGGEEFAWVLPDATLEDAVIAADRARTVIDAVPFDIAGQLTMSAGVSVVEAPASGDELYRLADRALYEAKQTGRNRTCCRIGADSASAQPADEMARRLDPA
jgi:diguanylate cyclase (GGDEF)-like protein/PAS domain S-box-containing protein